MKPFALLLLTLILMPLTGTAKPMTLEDCYQQALRFHEALPLAQQDVVQARAYYTQILGAVAPRLTLHAGEFLQERVNTAAAGVSSNFTRFSTPEVSLGLKQPLFHGLAEMYAAKSNRADLRQREHLVREAARGLYLDVATVFYTIAAIERGIRTSSHILSIQRAQTKTLAGWRELGKIRDSQLALQDTERALNEADLEKLKGDRKVAFEALAFLTGLQPQPQIAAGSPLQKKLGSLESYLTQAELRPDIAAAKERITMSQYNVKAAKGQLAPKIDLEANYYPYRVGFQEDIDWDVAFKMELPLIPISELGKIKETKSLAIQERLKTEQTLRSAQTEVRQAYAAFRASLEQLRKYQTAVSLAERSHTLIYDDQGLGLSTQVEVLSARRSWFDALKLRDEAEIDAWENWITLRIYSGITP